MNREAKNEWKALGVTVAVGLLGGIIAFCVPVQASPPDIPNHAVVTCVADKDLKTSCSVALMEQRGGKLFVTVLKENVGLWNAGFLAEHVNDLLFTRGIAELHECDDKGSPDCKSSGDSVRHLLSPSQKDK